jgi:hypothetical protein
VIKKLNTKRTNNPINKWTNELNRQFSKEVEMARKYMKKYTTFLALKEMSIKTNPQVRMAIIKKATTKNAGKDIG